FYPIARRYKEVKQKPSLDGGSSPDVEDPWTSSDDSSDSESQDGINALPVENSTYYDKKYEEKESAIEWHTRCVSTEHAIGAVFLALIWMLGNLSINVVVAHSGAYLLLDCLLMIIYRNELSDVGVSLIHHSAGLLGVFFQ